MLYHSISCELALLKMAIITLDRKARLRRIFHVNIGDMIIKNKSRSTPVIVNVHVHLDKPNPPVSPEIEKQEKKFTTKQTETTELGIFKPKIDYSYSVDVKFFNDQLINNIALGLSAVIGSAVLTNEAYSYVERLGGLLVIIFSLLSFGVGIVQTFKAIDATFKKKLWGKTLLSKLFVVIVLSLLLFVWLWAMSLLFKYGIKSANFTNLPGFCKPP